MNSLKKLSQSFYIVKTPLLIFVCFMVCVFTGGLFAQENEANTGKKPEDLLKTSWNLVSITTDKGEATLLNQHGITLIIDEQGRISGKSGVNQYFGSFSMVNGKISWGQMGCTEMAGPPDKMDAENLYVKSLSQTTTYQIAQDVLTFFDAATKTKVVFKAAKSSEK
jgi:heat shock protein HslJ